MVDAAIVIACADAQARERWRRSLTDLYEVHEVTETIELERIMRATQPRVLVIDLALPGVVGVESLPDLRRQSPASRMLVLTDCESEAEGISALRAGAKGYYSRTIDPPLLRKAVTALLQGEMWVKRTLVGPLVAGLLSLAEVAQRAASAKQGDFVEKEPEGHLENLTLRQREVAEAIARGASNKEIARRLNVTERTVKAHLTNMFRNVGVFDRLHLALLLNNVRGASAGSPRNDIDAASPKSESGCATGRKRGTVEAA